MNEFATSFAPTAQNAMHDVATLMAEKITVPAATVTMVITTRPTVHVIGTTTTAMASTTNACAAELELARTQLQERSERPQQEQVERPQSDVPLRELDLAHEDVAEGERDARRAVQERDLGEGPPRERGHLREEDRDLGEVEH